MKKSLDKADVLIKADSFAESFNNGESINKEESLSFDNIVPPKPDDVQGAELVIKIEGLTHQGEGVGRAGGLTHQGEGPGRTEGQVVFVPGALPGELVRVRVVAAQSRLLRGELLEVMQASPQRIEPACGYLAHCGGCNLQHAEYAEQLRLKQQIVKQALQRIGRLPAELPVKPTLGMADPWRYRNKVELHVEADRERGEVRLGYYQPGSHQVIDIADCLLLPAEMREILAAVKAGLSELLSSYLLRQSDTQPILQTDGVLVGERASSASELSASFPNELSNQLTSESSVKLPALPAAFPLNHLLCRQSFLTGEIALIWVVSAPDDLIWRKWVGEFGLALLQKFPKIICLAENINPTPFNTLLGRDTRIILGRPQIQEGIGDLRFLLSPVSFYQVNPAQTEVLYQHVLDFAQRTGTEKVLDVYCGVGTIALFLARSAAQVIGIEVVAEAVADAKRNAQLNGIKNAYFYKGTAEEWFKPQSPGKQSRSRGKKNKSGKGIKENPNRKSGSAGKAGVIGAAGATLQTADRVTASAVAAAAKDGISKVEKMYLNRGMPQEKGKLREGEMPDDQGKPDLVVLNPPRGGCDKIVLEGVSRLSPERIIYVSCNPATLARDLRFLVDKGYVIREIQPVDMFPQTHHVETVILLQCQKS